MLAFITSPLKFLLALGICVATVTVCLIVLVDPNNYKDKINSIVQQYTGREIIAGKIHWSVVPQLGLRVADISVTNHPEFSGPFFTAKQAQISISVVDLLRGALVINSIVIENPTIYLQKTKTGHTNFADLLALKKQTQQQSKEPTSASLVTDKNLHSHSVTTNQEREETEKKPAFRSLAINTLALENAKVYWQDAAKAKHFVLDDVNITTTALTTDKPQLAPVLITGKIQDLAMLSKQQLTFAASMHIDLAHNTFRLAPINIGYDKLTLAGDITAKIAPNSVQLSPINLEALGATHQARCNIDLTNASPTFSLHDTTNTFEINNLLATIYNYQKLHGNTTISADLFARGNESTAIKASLTGDIKLQIRAGSFVGINAHAVLDKTSNLMLNILSKLKVSDIKMLVDIPRLLDEVKDWALPTGDDAKTNFDLLQINAHFVDGVSRNTSLLVAHPDYKIEGSGQINLVNSSINMLISARYQNVASINDTTLANYLLQTPITITVQGDLYHPKISADLRTYCKDALKKLHIELSTLLFNALEQVIPGDSRPASDKQPPAEKSVKQIGKNLLNNLLRKKHE